MTSLELLGTARCGACGGKVGRANLVCLPQLATWKHPTHGNLLTHEHGRAIAVICDACADHGGGAIREAIEVRDDGAIVYHPIDLLAVGPPQRTYRLVKGPSGREGIECLKCGALSWNPNDVANLYCGQCHQFHQAAPQ